jgi:dipeptidyl-peptidase-4
MLAFLFAISGVEAQKTLSLKDAMIGAGTYLRPEMPRQLEWRGPQHYLLVKNDTLFQYDIKSEKPEKLMSLAEWSEKVQKAGLDEFKHFPRFSMIDENQISFEASHHFLVTNLTNQTIEINISYPENAENTDYCPENRTLTYTVKNNLFIAGVSENQQITNDENQYILNGQAVSRNEFGINKGTFWSPKGHLLAFYHMDETQVGDYPLVDYMTREATLDNIKYPMAGMASQIVKLGIYNLATRQVSYLKTGGEPDHYLTNISWAPDEKSVFIFELNRDQNQMLLNQYDVASGELIKTVLEEHDPKYVEPLHPAVFSKTDPDKFYYQSRTDGWNHVYRCSIATGKITQITQGNWEVTDFLGFDKDEKNMFFESTEKSPIERQLYEINLRSGKMMRLTQDEGTHAGKLSPDGQHLIDVWTDTEVPGKVGIITVKKDLEQTIFEAENTLKDFDLGENAVFTIKAADGKTDLYCRMIKPNHFDPNKKYPVIVYVYGGPHAQMVNKTWKNQARWWQYYMASKGYISFTVDSRGSDNRGKAFEDVIHRQFGVVETADQMKGIEYLESLPFVDKNRIGVHGWSYGGFMTLNLKLKHPEVFKVAVAGGPVVDWSMYEVMYGERYMDTPQENPEGYKNANMLNYVENLQGKLMLIHGLQDQTVVMQHSIKFLKKCVDLEKQVDFFVYPTHEHNVMGKDRVHLMEKVSEYFLDNL